MEGGDGDGAATYKTGHVVKDVKEVGEKVKVTYVDLKTGATGSMESDLVVAADGAQSTIRRKLCPEVSPEVSPKYAGYVTWRGRVPESAMPSKTREVLRDRCVIPRVEGGYQISYV